MDERKGRITLEMNVIETLERIYCLFYFLFDKWIWKVICVQNKFKRTRAWSIVYMLYNNAHNLYVTSVLSKSIIYKLYSDPYGV